MEEKIIESVRSHPVLYDVNHADYVKTKLKQDIWSEIAKDVNVNNGKYYKNNLFTNYVNKQFRKYLRQKDTHMCRK
jgi:hypothetical protein